MSKENQEQKDYAAYDYAGDEEIKISVGEFRVLKLAIDQAIANGVTVQRPQRTRWVEKGTDKEVKFSFEKATSGKIEQQVDVEATKSDENVQVIYDNKLFPHIFGANEVIMGIHFRNVEEGVAKTKEEKEAYIKSRKAKGQMKIQEDDEPVAAPKQNPEAGNAPMGVVKDEPETSEGEDKQ